MNAPAPGVQGILETSLYVADLERARRFYTDLFGFAELFADDRMVALEVPGRQVLLLFLHGASRAIDQPDGGLPGHDGWGSMHFAFAISRAALPAWRARLAARGVAVELEKAWPRGGFSLYFRDPDGHLAELATPGLWWPA
jgi:catechol 2,3-dioxygenase-like lactoylglutathione lyase family enzyme